MLTGARERVRGVSRRRAALYLGVEAWGAEAPLSAARHMSECEMSLEPHSSGAAAF